MSTFRGVVHEIPDIRIDFFRPIPGLRPPRKCFLSHVHSDHLAGLEAPSFKTCFIYCSAATREILLRLEKYPQRLNFQKGILERPPKVTYKHLDKLLKTIPLETPTQIELDPGNYIQVTLFDANHCTGAVMFLIESDNKAILYTGDIRSEPWFVNSLTRNPFLIEYTSGLKTLDCIYLDTSNTRDIAFPPKADGLKELLQKVSKYPADTVFHFAAWTFGYEEVWMALSRALNSQIHVDDYKMRLYASLRGKGHDPKDPTNDTHLSGPFLAHEGPALTGYKCGNTPQAGCLTSKTNVRIHSCEKGLQCDKLNDKTVWIRPIVTRTKNGDVDEVGVGGGGGDLTRRLEIELKSAAVINDFLGLFADTEDLVKMDIKRQVGEGLKSRRTALSLDDIGLDPNQGNIPLSKIAEALTRSVLKEKNTVPDETHPKQMQFEALPRLITFPYSRHSSYPELRHLVKTFNPRDVYPCTVDEANWDEEVSMESLFGRDCNATQFRHDFEMRAMKEEQEIKNSTQQTHTTATTEASSQIMPPSSPVEQSVSVPPTSAAQQKALGSEKFLIRRNSEGLLRPFDVDGNEAIPLAGEVQQSIASTFPKNPSQELQKDIAEMVSALNSTPSKVLVTTSPGSASQNLRRKAIHEGLEGQVKRARLSYDGIVSSQSAATSSSQTPQKDQAFSVLVEIPDQSDNGGDAAHTPGSDADSPVRDLEHSAEQVVDPPTSSEVLDVNTYRPHWPPTQHLSNIKLEEMQFVVFADHVDEVLRCKMCGHEAWNLWTEQIGFCTGDCKLPGREPIEVPYFEVVEPGSGPCPQYELDDFENEPWLGADIDVRDILGGYLDYDSDAYDTLDEDTNERPERSEYDSEDSFIDNASIHSIPMEDTEEDKLESDKNVDYKTLFNELQRKHTRLISRHEEVMQDVLETDFKYNSDTSEESYLSADIDIEEIDEYGALIVDVTVPNPEVVELVLSQAQEQSQQSELSDGRIQDRVKAFEAAAGGEVWNISLVSTGDNHTLPEIEL